MPRFEVSGENEKGERKVIGEFDVTSKRVAVAVVVGFVAVALWPRGWVLAAWVALVVGAYLNMARRWSER